MASLNRVTLIGHLGRDPETRFLPNGDAVCNVSIATTETWKDKAGERQEKTEWHRVTFYRRLAEIAGEYLKKGSQVYVEGRIETRKYQGKDGTEKYSTEIIAHEMKMLGGKGGGNSALRDYVETLGEESGASKKEPAAPTQPKRAAKLPAGIGEMEDDVPF